MSQLPERLMIPAGYKPILSVRETESAIKEIKDYFQQTLAARLNLQRISAPLFVDRNTGMNDNLNGVERPVNFSIAEHPDTRYEIVQSLAKWKRNALHVYGFEPGEGLYTDMNAIRRDEVTDNIHSIYVDQWDWEKVITPEQRNLDTLKETVRSIYAVLKSTNTHVSTKYSFDPLPLPDEIFFITAQELEDMYPDLTPAQREDKIVREKHAVFVIGIGGNLRSGAPHDGRSPDYDDWSLNGDIIVYNPVLDIPFELSSMGVRVDSKTMLSQLAERGVMERAELPFHKSVIDGTLPQSIGGGIGQSRLCMLFLHKAHIGEVHSSVWPDFMVEKCAEAGIPLL